MVKYVSFTAHVKSAKEEVLSLTEECRAFEKEKKDAETKLEVLTNFFNEKEAQRQKYVYLIHSFINILYKSNFFLMT